MSERPQVKDNEGISHTTATAESERSRMQPGLLRAAEAACIYDMTDGFCHPRNSPGCRCWKAAEDVQRATGMSAQAVAWVFRCKSRIEREAAS